MVECFLSLCRFDDLDPVLLRIMPLHLGSLHLKTDIDLLSVALDSKVLRLLNILRCWFDFNQYLFAASRGMGLEIDCFESHFGDGS
jgi:hypothetical protein